MAACEYLEKQVPGMHHGVFEHAETTVEQTDCIHHHETRGSRELAFTACGISICDHIRYHQQCVVPQSSKDEMS